MKSGGAVFGDVKVHVKFKLAGLWTSLMFCYIYNDYFELHQPGTLQEMLRGKMGPLGLVTQGALLGTAAMLAIPALMIFLSLSLRPNVNRSLNIVLGFVYTLIAIVTIPGSWAYYIFLDVIEVILTLLIVWQAWHWPKESAVLASS